MLRLNRNTAALAMATSLLICFYSLFVNTYGLLMLFPIDELMPPMWERTYMAGLGALGVINLIMLFMGCIKYYLRGDLRLFAAGTALYIFTQVCRVAFFHWATPILCLMLASAVLLAYRVNQPATFKALTPN